MRSHFHLHLEPEERKRASLGLGRYDYRSREQFFDAHRLGRKDRVAVTGKDLETFLTDLHEEQRAQSVDYVELRLSPRRFVSDGMSWTEFLRKSHAVLRRLDDPRVRAILLLNRDSPPSLIDECHQHVKDGLPSTFVGLDLAGDEVRFPQTDAFRSLFESARAGGLGVTVHAGEFGGPEHVWRALDELGALRIGHGLAAVVSTSLLERLGRDAVLVETSLGSNLALGAVNSLQDHPARVFAERGIPLCFNADVPLHTGRTLVNELAMAADLLGTDYSDVVELQSRAALFAFGRGVA